MSAADIVTILAVLIPGIIAIIAAFKAKAVAKETNIAVHETKALVNGRYGEVLKELAAVKNLLAASTGAHSDQIKADVAQANSDSQADMVSKLEVRKTL